MGMTQSTTLQSSTKRWLPLIILAGLIAMAYGFGLHKYLTLQTIAENRAALQDYVSTHLALAILIFMAIYIVVVALSLPGAAILSIVGGFVFGWALSVPVTVVAATIGSIIVFQIVKTSVGAAIAEKAGPFVKRLSDGFAKDAFNYLLFLRLVPAFPFFVVNAVAGVCRVNLRTFIIATFIGIIPGAFAFAWLGRGLGSVIDAQTIAHDACVANKGLANCPFELSVSSLVTPQLLIAFAILGVVALIPVALKKWKTSK
jgi:uncharacterized membrane protein YdjX (TVP38/TMEM64 family)